MATVTVETVVQSITISLAIDEARGLLLFFSSLDQQTAPPFVQQITRRFKSAIERETFVTSVD